MSLHPPILAPSILAGNHANLAGSIKIVAEAGYRQISDQGALQAAVDEIIAENPDAAADVRAGKQQAIGYLTGQVMKKTRGQANAAVVKDLLRATFGSG